MVPTRKSFSIWLLVAFLVAGTLLFGLAIAILPVGLAIGFGIVLILPFIALLYFNQTYDTRAGLRALEYFFPIYIVFSIVWPRYLAFSFGGGPDITPARIMLAVLLLLWGWTLISPSCRRELFVSIRQNKLFFGLLSGYIVWRFITAFFSEVLGLSMYQYVKELFEALLMGFIVISAVRTTDHLWRLLHLLMLATLVVILVGVVEKIINSNPFSHFLFHGFHFSNEYVEEALADKTRSGKYRIESTFANPLLFVEYISFILPIAISVAVMSPSRMYRWMGALAVPGIVGLAAFTGSRSSLVVIALSLGLLGLLLVVRAIRMKQFARVVLMISFGTPLLTALVGTLMIWKGVDLSIVTGRSVDEMNSTHARLEMLNMAIPRFLEHPILGFGNGLAAEVLGFNAGTQLTIDNYYISLILDSGLPGLLLFLSLFFVAAYTGIKVKSVGNDNLAFLGGLLAMSIFSMLVVKSILSIPHNLPYLVIAAALTCRLAFLQGNVVQEKIMKEKQLTKFARIPVKPFPQIR